MAGVLPGSLSPAPPGPAAPTTIVTVAGPSVAGAAAIESDNGPADAPSATAATA